MFKVQNKINHKLSCNIDEPGEMSAQWTGSRYVSTLFPIGSTQHRIEWQQEVLASRNISDQPPKLIRSTLYVGPSKYPLPRSC